MSSPPGRGLLGHQRDAPELRLVARVDGGTPHVRPDGEYAGGMYRTAFNCCATTSATAAWMASERSSIVPGCDAAAISSVISGVVCPPGFCSGPSVNRRLSVWAGS